eukprot:m.20718 g.20718  ORF g.20718 m.20718 type:complete len:216 (+) comp28067_c0_seq2:127-774(+)
MAQLSCSANPMPGFDYFLALDFEATCDEPKNPSPQEIIEFSAILLNSTTLKTEEFHSFVQPASHPILTAFCKKLTGIEQEQINGQPKFPEVLQTFDQWLKEHNLLDSTSKFCFVTCGNWDINGSLFFECKHLALDVPSYFRKWINIKKLFKVTFKLREPPKTLRSMLDQLKLEPEGQRNSGIDDAKNIAKIFAELLRRDPELKGTASSWVQVPSR